MTWRAQTTATLLLFTTSSLFGCASTQVDSAHGGVGQIVGERWPTWAGGEPSDTPLPRAPTLYPNVNDMPPSRPLQTLSSEQQRKAVADLDASRRRVSDQMKAAKAFDQKLTAKELANATKGQLAAGVLLPPN
ncbi:MAG: hypothetical protein J2P54_05090 [Bradyrhizobiaceae bacterium]|nr:hypothetical protein [Bradyrhizobiaceae bacterium]